MVVRLETCVYLALPVRSLLSLCTVSPTLFQILLLPFPVCPSVETDAEVRAQRQLIWAFEVMPNTKSYVWRLRTSRRETSPQRTWCSVNAIRYFMDRLFTPVLHPSTKIFHNAKWVVVRFLPRFQLSLWTKITLEVKEAENDDLPIAETIFLSLKRLSGCEKQSRTWLPGSRQIRTQAALKPTIDVPVTDLFTGIKPYSPE